MSVVSPHRHQEFREPCALCPELSMSMCRRCERPLCPAHSHLEAPWCSACEQLWLSRRVELVAPLRQPNAVLFRIGRIFALGGLVPLVLLALYRDSAPAWVGAVVFVGSYLLSEKWNTPERVDARARRAFMREAGRALGRLLTR
jgi:hypothetical protein